MTTTMHESSTDQPDCRDIASRLLVPEFRAALSIVAIWLAVLFDGIVLSHRTTRTGRSAR
jgi:hypothetical protein